MKKIIDDRKFLTKKMLAERWSCSERTIDRIVVDGMLPAINLNTKRGHNKTVRFSILDIQVYEDSNKEY
jgi:hypothetical protein